tara:strand:- start:1077 stop:1619 length:543 start_codon:yes stop_codon:yes gene_type:complete
MAGIIKVNQYQDFNGNTLLTSDGSGNLTTQKINEPFLKVIRASSNQTSISSATATKIQFNSEDALTKTGTWDSTNYRWTPGVAGKYLISINVEIVPASSTAKQCLAYIYKNGSSICYGYLNMNDMYLRSSGSNVIGAVTIDTATATDYYEGFVYMQTNSGTVSVRAQADNTNLIGYRIGS